MYAAISSVSTTRKAANSRLKSRVCAAYIIKKGSNILYVSSKSDIIGVPMIKGILEIKGFDFEKLKEMGIDAVEWVTGCYLKLFEFWDCDSIVVLNPDIVVPIKEN